jgi:hypothetical protein
MRIVQSSWTGNDAHIYVRVEYVGIVLARNWEPELLGDKLELFGSLSTHCYEFDVIAPGKQGR